MEGWKNGPKNLHLMLQGIGFGLSKRGIVGWVAERQIRGVPLLSYQTGLYSDVITERSSEQFGFVVAFVCISLS